MDEAVTDAVAMDAVAMEEAGAVFARSERHHAHFAQSGSCGMHLEMARRNDGFAFRVRW